MPTFLGATSYVTPGTGILTLSPPGVGAVGVYIVTSTATTPPSTTPDFTGEAYSMRWPTSTPWESTWFVLVVRGSATLPTLQWTWGTTETFVWLEGFVDSASWVLAAADAVFTSNTSPQGSTGCDFSLRTFAVNGADGTGVPPVVIPSLGSAAAESFEISPNTLAVGMNETTPPDAESAVTWTTIGSLGPYFGWGATVSIYPANAVPDPSNGWALGMRA